MLLGPQQKHDLMLTRLPQLTTERLLLSAPTTDDLPQIILYAGDEKIARYTLNIPHPYQEKDATFWLNMASEGLADGSKYIFAVRDKATGAFRGGVGLHINAPFNSAELGYWIAVPFWGQGLMTEAVGAILRFGFAELGLRRVYAHHITENEGSGKVMLKNRMVREGLLRQHAFKNGSAYDLAIYGILREEFNQQQITNNK